MAETARDLRRARDRSRAEVGRLCIALAVEETANLRYLEALQDACRALLVVEVGRHGESARAIILRAQGTVAAAIFPPPPAPKP